jgi:hypothetical protein
VATVGGGNPPLAAVNASKVNYGHSPESFTGQSYLFGAAWDFALLGAFLESFASRSLNVIEEWLNVLIEQATTNPRFPCPAPLRLWCSWNSGQSSVFIADATTVSEVQAFAAREGIPPKSDVAIPYFDLPDVLSASCALLDAWRAARHPLVKPEMRLAGHKLLARCRGYLPKNVLVLPRPDGRLFHFGSDDYSQESSPEGGWKMTLRGNVSEEKMPDAMELCASLAAVQLPAKTTSPTDLSWAKDINAARQTGAENQAPTKYHWDTDAGTLRVGDVTLDLFPPRKRRAPEQEAILDSFQAKGWPLVLEVPSISHANINRLNIRIKKLKSVPLSFHVAEGGKAIRLGEREL